MATTGGINNCSKCKLPSVRTESVPMYLEWSRFTWFGLLKPKHYRQQSGIAQRVVAVKKMFARDDSFDMICEDCLKTKGEGNEE